MRATRVVTAAVFIAVFAASAAAQVRNVAVVETEIDAASGASGGITPSEVRQVTSELRREAVKNLPPDRFNIMTTETVYAQGSAVLEECSEENCVIALGSRIGADYIVRGIISKLRERLTLSVEVYETENGNLVASSAAVRAEKVEELVEKAAAACADMYEKFVCAQGSRQKQSEKYIIVARANPVKGGTVLRNPTQEEYRSGTSVEIAAVPAKGYVFTGWSGAATDTVNPVKVIMDDNMMLMANFKYIDQNAAVKGHKLIISVSPEDGGFVARYPDAKAYADKERVILTATAVRGYRFVDWTDDAPGESEKEASNSGLVARTRDLTVTMDGNKTFTANFRRLIFDGYFAFRYELPIGIPSSWGGVDFELGWLWGNGGFFGFDIGGGGDSDGMLLGFGVNLGNVYHVWNDLQIVYGGAVGIWYVSEFGEEATYTEDWGYSYTYQLTPDKHYLNLLAPFAGIRWKVFELTYRGLYGNTKRWDSEAGTERFDYGWNQHQLMLGFHFAGSKRWRAKK